MPTKVRPFRIDINHNTAIVFVSSEVNTDSVKITMAIEELMHKYNAPETTYLVKELGLDTSCTSASTEESVIKSERELKAKIERVFWWDKS